MLSGASKCGFFPANSRIQKKTLTENDIIEYVDHSVINGSLHFNAVMKKLLFLLASSVF